MGIDFALILPSYPPSFGHYMSLSRIPPLSYTIWLKTR